MSSIEAPGRVSDLGSAEALGRRERKKHATRQALHEAALSLVESRGLARVTIEAITDEVDVATRTFSNYYSSKEEAVLGPHGDPVELASGLSARLAMGQHPLGALQETLVADARAHDTTSERLRRRIRLLRSEPTLLAVAAARSELASSHLSAAVADATGLDARSDPYPALVVHVALAAVRASMMRWVDDPSVPLDAVVDESFRLVRSGLQVPPAACAPTR